jgi:hypothetical protein
MKVLFVGLVYHDYTRSIIEEMEREGAIVTFVDIQPRQFFYNLCRIVSRSRYESFLRKYHARVLRKAGTMRFDRVVFLQAHQVALDSIEALRCSLPGVPFILYNWDSLLTHDYLAQARHFDEIFTFDASDAVAHGFKYLPLFGTRAIQNLRRDRVRHRSIYTVGNIVNPKRYHAIQEFKRYCESHGIAFEVFLRITPVVFWRMLKAGVVPRGVSFWSIDSKKFHNMIERSQAVFDFSNHQQSGHTMRTIENMMCGKKIITNNSCLQREPFYSQDRFLVYDGLNFSEVLKFLDTPLADEDAGFEDYGIQSFTRQLLLLNRGGALN